MTRTFCDRCGKEAVVESVAVGYWAGENARGFSWLPDRADGPYPAAIRFPWGRYQDLCAYCVTDLVRFMGAKASK